MRISQGWLAVLLIFSLAGYAVAEDLALIKIESQNQVETATRLFGHAYARAGNSFLVSLDARLTDSLATAGITSEIIMRDISIRSACVAIPNHRGKMAGLDPTTLGEGVLLEQGVYLLRQATGAASAAKDRGELFIIPLADRHIYFHYRPPIVALPASPMDVFPTDTIANRINLDTIRAMNQRLEAFRTRYIPTESCLAARDWIVSKFQSWGYTQVSTPMYLYYGFPIYNVKVIKPGYAEPDKIVVVGGHYDSWNGQGDPYTFAPGSDDDGSGTALTMELARVLANIPLRKTVIFMPFTAEEVGLIGSAHAAEDFRAAGASVEAMLNYDMVGYTIDSYWDLSLSSGPNNAYLNLCTQVAGRVTSLFPKTVTMGTSSDHYSFYEQGYDIVDNIESDFNNQGWHTNTDLTSLMNFNYFNQVVRLAAVSTAQIANSGSPVGQPTVLDVGNGSDIDVTITDCVPGTQYWLYWGTSPNALTLDSAIIPSGQCSHRVTGLTTGTRYYFGVFSKPSDGYRSVWAGVGSEMPLVVPRTPTSLAADPGDNLINLDWGDNTEVDFSHYHVYRRLEMEQSFDLLADNLTSSAYIDNQVVGGLQYFYEVTAVDQSGNESPVSAIVSSYPATFDGGILVVDDFTQDYEYFADQAHQAAWFDTVLGFSYHGLARVDSTGQTLPKGTAGRYSSIIWDDDDFFLKQLGANASLLEWYLSHTTNMMICGMKTVQTWSPNNPVNTNHLLYKEFMVSSYYLNNFEIFNGGVGVNGWPNAVWAPNRGVVYASDCPILNIRSGGTVIMTYDAIDDDPKFEGKPCGVAYSGPKGKRVVFSFPLYYLTPASATAIMTKVKEYFGESAGTIPPGDINHSGLADPADLSILVSYLTGSMPQLPDPNGGDVNGSCFVDATDLTYLVAYLTTGQVTLVNGCVNP